MIKKSLIVAVASISLALFFACGNKKPNDKLKIEDKIYTISLGEINYDTETSLITIEVLADGQPMPNITQYTKTTINIGGQERSSISSSQPVKMMLMIKGRGIFANQGTSSEDGVFSFEVEEVPDIINVFTDAEEIHFNAKTKEILSQKEYNLLMKEWIKKNREELGIE